MSGQSVLRNMSNCGGQNRLGVPEVVYSHKDHLCRDCMYACCDTLLLLVTSQVQHNVPLLCNVVCTSHAVPYQAR